ncbi:MAG: D-alanine--D-alanine ligase [Lewinellaceae bacterium]|nr:D-alanine--D-alanine ligase [Saprospiraceae bacterium]MCB9331315.1 D-alanine--D-alanine ligase [Lewinellaceae bacterium]
MKNIAILTGGDSAERVISLQSSQVVADHLPKDRYVVFQIDIEGADWKDRETGAQIDKNDFTLPLPDGRRIRFDCVFGALHGSPLEDGKMQGYFDMLGLPYTCCNGYVSGLTMNKYHSKMYVAPFGVPVAKSVLLHRGEPVDVDRLLELGLPLFVKPNTHGSSFGVTKVKTAAELLPAIEAVWPYDSEALVEAFMDGREFSNGVLRVNGEVVAMPVTEIIPETEFFDFAAKYEGRSQEITPAKIPDDLARQCQERSSQLYEILHCRGVVRFDYILVGDTFHFLEANTIPGISPASIVPQQAVAHGWQLGEFFGLLIEEAMRQ